MALLSMIPMIIFGLLGLGLIVFTHETGHFIAAKLCGVAVETFSLGWGKKMVGFKFKGTTYQLAWFPIGGYCKMKGEMQTPQQIDKNDFSKLLTESDTYLAASWWKKIIISISGPLANVLFALVFFTITNLIGYHYLSPDNRIILAESEETTPAMLAGLQTGDRILEINRKKVVSFEDFAYQIRKNPEKELPLVLERNGKLLETVITPQMYKMTGRIGVYGWVEPVVTTIEAGKAAEQAGFQLGDRIVAIDGQPVTNDFDIGQALESSPARILVTMERARQKREIVMDLEYTEDNSLDLGMSFMPTYRSPYVNLAGALGLGFEQVAEILDITLRGFAYLFSIEKEDLKDAVAGPIRITQLVGEYTLFGFKLGFGDGIAAFFRLVCMLSTIMALMNLIPIPALDGGQIMLSLYMVVFKNKISAKFIYRYQVVGFFIVFLLLTIAVFSDIFNLIG